MTEQQSESLEHDRAGDVWERHADGPKRDKEADRTVRKAIQAEQRGEYNGETWQPSTWKSA